MKKPEISVDQVMDVLNACYGQAVQGIPGTKSCSDLAAEYLARYKQTDKAASALINNQIAKCTVSGFLTSLGGLITLPIAIPANLATVWYMQIRMVGAVAVMAGFDPTDDAVQTLVYLCLTGTSASKICRDAGVKITNKLTQSLINKIPGSVLKAINSKVGFRLITKAGTTGIINLGKMVPLAGGVIGGGFDFVGTRVIADKAVQVFIKGTLD